MIHCDWREQRSGIPGLLIDAGCEVQFAQLPVGDYVIGDVLVERKSAFDLDGSIKNRRLFDQVERAAAAYPRVLVLIESGPGSLPEVGRIGALAKLVRMHAAVSVVHVEDREQLALWLVRLERQTLAASSGEGQAVRNVLDPAMRKQRLSDDDVRLLMLARVPGVGAKAAGALLAAHGNLGTIALLDVRELRKVEGIGKVRAQRIYEIIHGNVAAARDEDEDLI
jgi:DNA excision repair protein ERCC-4